MADFNLKPVIKNVINKEKEIIEIIDTMFLNRPKMSIEDIQKSATDENLADMDYLLGLMNITKDVVKSLQERL